MELVQQTKFGKSLVINSRSHILINLLAKVTNCNGLDIRPINEHWRDLLFLEKIFMLNSLSLGNGMSLESFSGIESQSQLISLSLDASSNCEFDWIIFRKLKEVYTKNQYINPDLWTLKALESLGISNYRKLDFEEINNISTLGRLLLIQTKIKSLRSLSLPRIRALEIRGASDLREIGGTPSANSIEELRLIGCPNLGSIDGIQEYGNLRRLLLLECGKLETLHPLAGMNSLESINVCGTTIGDGSIRFLLKSPRLRHLEFIDSVRYDLKSTGSVPNNRH